MTSKNSGCILRCARVGSELVDGTPPGTVEQTCERCAYPVHVSPKSLEKVRAASALHVVLCVECVRDPRLPDFLAFRSGN